MPVVFPSGTRRFSPCRCEDGVVVTSMKHIFSLTSQANSLAAAAVRVPLLSEVLHWILCRVTANQTLDGAMQSKTFVDGHNVRIAVTGVVVMFMVGTLIVSNMICRHALSVSLGVQESFREQNGMLFRRSTKFVVECVRTLVARKCP